jgi:hypothetical protein
VGKSPRCQSNPSFDDIAVDLSPSASPVILDLKFVQESFQARLHLLLA